MPLDEDGGSEGVVIVVGIFVGRGEIGCGEAEIVIWVDLVRGDRGLVPRRWESVVEPMGWCRKGWKIKFYKN